MKHLVAVTQRFANKAGGRINLVAGQIVAVYPTPNKDEPGCDVLIITGGLVPCMETQQAVSNMIDVAIGRATSQAPNDR